MGEIGTSTQNYIAFLSTDELSAGVWSSSEVDGYKNLVANRYVNKMVLKQWESVLVHFIIKEILCQNHKR